MDCRLTVAQTNPALGNVGRNLEEHVAAIEAAIAGGSQLIVFPELSLTGYFLKDQTACSCFAYVDGAVIKCSGPDGPAVVEKLKNVQTEIRELAIENANIVEVSVLY